jgi:hypothetical protein
LLLVCEKAPNRASDNNAGKVPRSTNGSNLARLIVHQERRSASPTCHDRQGGFPQGDVAKPATKGRIVLLGAQTNGGFFMGNGPKTRQGGAIYHGFVPDTDPRYKSGWNYLSGKNLNPHLKKKSADEAQEEAGRPVKPEKGEDR